MKQVRTHTCGFEEGPCLKCEKLLRSRRTNPMKLVVMESPFRGETGEERSENIRFARACIVDCLKHDESPIASHLLYTQPGILNDDFEAERQLGISAGHEWILAAEGLVVYTNRGVSSGMEQGIAYARKYGTPIEYRVLQDYI